MACATLPDNGSSVHVILTLFNKGKSFVANFRHPLCIYTGAWLQFGCVQIKLCLISRMLLSQHCSVIYLCQHRIQMSKPAREILSFTSVNSWAPHTPLPRPCCRQNYTCAIMCWKWLSRTYILYCRDAHVSATYVFRGNGNNVFIGKKISYIHRAADDFLFKCLVLYDDENWKVFEWEIFNHEFLNDFSWFWCIVKYLVTVFSFVTAKNQQRHITWHGFWSTSRVNCISKTKFKITLRLSIYWKVPLKIWNFLVGFLLINPFWCSS